MLFRRFGVITVMFDPIILAKKGKKKPILIPIKMGSSE
jgi:hypothetical protein